MGEPDQTTTDEEGRRERVLLLVAGREDRRLLTEWLTPTYAVTAAGPNDTWGEFDVCLVDHVTYRTVRGRLTDRRRLAAPVYLPVLLLDDSGSPAETFEGPADDAVGLPVRKARLWARLESLLRARRLSLDLRRERNRLELYRRAMDEATVGIVITDAEDDQPITYANAAFERITGYDAEDIRGRNCRFLQGPETDPDAVAVIRAAVEGEYPVSVELRNYRANGEPFWNRVTVTPVHDDAGTLTHFLGFQEDVTSRVELERLEHEERELIEGLFDTSPVGIVVLDTEGTIVRANETAEEVLGLERSDVLGRAFDAPEWEIVDADGDRIPAEELPFSLALSGESVVGYEHGIRAADGERWLSINAVPWYDDDGVVSGVLAAVRDETERRRRTRERERLLERLEQVQSLADIGSWEFDATTDAWTWSEQTYRVYGVDPETFEPTGEAIVERYHPEDRERVRSVTRRALREAEPYDVEVRVNAAGEERWVALHGTPVVEDGDVVGLLGAVQDVSDRKARERRLSVFDRVLRHNLRNKLNVVQGYAGELDGGDEELVAEAVEGILGATEELVALSEKVRHFDSTVTPLASAVERVDLASAAETVVREVEAANPGVDIVLTLPDAAWGRAHEAVELAIEEVIENAVIHTGGDASVTVTVEDRPELDVVEVSVADTGPGLPAMEREVLAKGTETPLEHMEGIGLWLVNWTVTSSGGSVDIRDNDPVGTVVALRFPRREGPGGTGLEHVLPKPSEESLQ